MQNRNIINGFSGIEYICSTEYNGIHNHMHYIHVVREKHGIQSKHYTNKTLSVTTHISIYKDSCKQHTHLSTEEEILLINLNNQQHRVL